TARITASDQWVYHHQRHGGRGFSSRTSRQGGRRPTGGGASCCTVSVDDGSSTGGVGPGGGAGGSSTDTVETPQTAENACAGGTSTPAQRIVSPMRAGSVIARARAGPTRQLSPPRHRTSRTP